MTLLRTIRRRHEVAADDDPAHPMLRQMVQVQSLRALRHRLAAIELASARRRLADCDENVGAMNEALNADVRRVAVERHRQNESLTQHRRTAAQLSDWRHGATRMLDGLQEHRVRLDDSRRVRDAASDDLMRHASHHRQLEAGVEKYAEIVTELTNERA